MDITVREDNLEWAMALHRSCPVVDAHLDLAGEILIRHESGESDVIRKYYLENFRKAGIKLIFSSVFVENKNIERAWENAMDQIRVLKEEIKSLPEVVLITSREELNALLSGDKIGIVLYMEGLECIGEDIDKLNELYLMGIRGASLVWSRKGALATGCCTARDKCEKKGPLTKAGIRAIERLEELSMFLDISHLNDEGFEQVCHLANRPFLATHSGSRNVYDSYRNLTDEQMRALAGKGGIMGVNGCKYIAGSLAGNHLEMLCRHVEYEVEKIGETHVGYGFDLCDSYERGKAVLEGRISTSQDDCLTDHGQIPFLTAALLQRGMKEEDVRRIIGENFADYLKMMLPEK